MNIKYLGYHVFTTKKVDAQNISEQIKYIK